MNPKISIITVTYNSEKVIEKTILSVLNQYYNNLEYILVDGKSEDRTVDIFEKYIPILKEKGVSVKFISEPDKGISDAFNKGIRLSTGGIIGITNSDDMILDGSLNFVAEHFQDESDVFYGNCLWRNEEKKIEYVRKSSADLSDLKIRLKILHPATYIKKTAYEKYGDYDEGYKYCMDKELLARMQRKGATFSYANRNLVSVAAGGVSDKNLKGVMQEGERIAVLNGVTPQKAKWIFKKNYVVIKIKQGLKKIALVNRVIQEKKNKE